VGRFVSVGISLHFKVSVNTVIVPQVLPLPSPEEIFSTLADGESFSELDLAQAYKQMQESESSKPFMIPHYQYTHWNIQSCSLLAKSDGPSSPWDPRSSLFY